MLVQFPPSWCELGMTPLAFNCTFKCTRGERLLDFRAHLTMQEFGAGSLNNADDGVRARSAGASGGHRGAAPAAAGHRVASCQHEVAPGLLLLPRCAGSLIP